MPGMDPLRALNLTQGYFTRQDALLHGYGDRDVHRLLKSRAWRRIRVGTYTHADLWPESEEARHRLAGRALFRKLDGAVALSHTTAALEHGMRLWGPALSDVHVTRLDGGAGRTEAGAVHHEGFVVDTDLVRHEDLVLTEPARSAIETASLGTAEEGLVTLDSALHLGLCTPAQLLATYQLMQAWPGMQRVGVTVRMADGGGQSVGESRVRYAAFAQGLPAPSTQFEVRDRSGGLIAVCDLAWPQHRLLLEFDGRVKYAEPWRDRSPAQVLWEEKRREDAVRATGIRTVRIVNEDLGAPWPRMVARLQGLLATPYVGPRRFRIVRNPEPGTEAA